MKNLVSLFLGICLLATHTAPAATTPPTEPTIMAVRGRIVRIRVPAGFDRVTLQQSVIPRSPARARPADRWRTLATKYPRGSETVITLRLPTLVSKRYLRVFGNKLDPLPASLLTGITSFLPDPPEADATRTTDSLTNGSINTSSGVAGTTGHLSAGDSSARTVVESDIWKVQGNRLYFFNELRGLQVFDLSKPAAPALLGTLRLPGSGEEMYLPDTTHAVLLKRSAALLGGIVYGLPVDTLPVESGLVTTFGGAPANAGISNAIGSNLTLEAGVSLPTSNRVAVEPRTSGADSGEIIVADVSDGAPKLVARVPYEGTLAESRMVGSVLYLATNVYHAATDEKASEYGLRLTSFDLADPAVPVQRDSIFLGGWANAVTATDRFFLVAKYADSDGSWSHNEIDLIDISSSDGAMQRAGKAIVRGNISSKFQMNIDGDVLTAVAQNWGQFEAGDPNDLVFRATSFTELQTFSIKNPKAPAALGSVTLAPGETVRATRFDAKRAYIVTFRQIDPLFVVDLMDPATPAVSGHVEAPGFSTYIEPLGDRLVTIGLLGGRPAVSLFDVSDPAAPKLLSQIALGSEAGWSHSEAVWNEKAFKVLPDENLILVPVSGSGEDHGWFSRVQLLDLLPDKIVKRGAIEQEFSPRRATLVNHCIVAISPTRLVTVDAADRDKPVLKADLEIAWSVDRVFNVGRYLVQLGGSADWGDHRAPKLSVSPSDDTDETLTAIDLVNLPVVGATVKDGVLYLAQGQPGYSYASANDARNPQPLTVSAYDLANLPALRLIGSVSTQTRLESGDLTPLWPSPGILVWAGSAGGSAWRGRVWHDPEPYHFQKVFIDGVPPAGVENGDALIDPPGYWMDRWFYAHPSRLVAFDFTRPQTPKFLSDIQAGGGQPWDLSDPFEANGVVYFSYKYLGKLLPAESADNAAPDQTDEQPSPRASRHFLLRVDYADPAAPIIDDTEINLPGELAGLARAGRLLFTIGQNYDLTTGTPKKGESALQVSAFDGTADHLLDTLPLASRNAPVSIQGETIFALDGQPAWLWNWPVVQMDRVNAPAVIGLDRFWGGGTSTENPKKSLLSAWRLDAAGKFHKLGEIEADHDTSLFVFGSLVVTQGERTLHLFDASDATKLEHFGSFEFSGWVWPDLNHAAGGLDAGLWAPLGAYGVETVAAPPAAR